MNRRQFFDKHAEKWDALFPGGFVNRVQNDIVPRLRIGRGETVLDVGSGTGILLPSLKKAVGEEGEVIAMDFSGLMLRKAEEKYGNAFTYVRANTEKTPFKAGYFDTIVCFSVFPHFVHALKALREFRRILKPGGRVVVAHANSREAINAFHRKAGTIVAHDLLPDDPTMERMMRAAGFKNIVIEHGADRYFAMGEKDRRGLRDRAAKRTEEL